MMSGYTVTITPSGSRPGSQTTIHVDTASGTARVTEFTVRARGNSLSQHELPAIDLVGLVAALTPAAKPAETPAAGRAYRRMPDQDEVIATWRESHSTGAVAEHFGVPRHTATGWLRRLRRLGVIEATS
jgi:hypothetical protein